MDMADATRGEDGILPVRLSDGAGLHPEKVPAGAPGGYGPTIQIIVQLLLRSIRGANGTCSDTNRRFPITLPRIGPRTELELESLFE